jgi:hypothetical protein
MLLRMAKQKKPVARVRVTGEKYVDIQLWGTANYLLRLGNERDKGFYHPYIAASLFAFFAFEAFLNEVGRNLEPKVWEKERDFFKSGKYQGTLGKFKLLAEKVSFAYDTTKRPFQTAKELGRVRDRIAHGRVERFDEIIRADRLDAHVFELHFEKWGTKKAAERAMADIEQLADGLLAASKVTRGKYAAGYRGTAFHGVTAARHATLHEEKRA